MLNIKSNIEEANGRQIDRVKKNDSDRVENNDNNKVMFSDIDRDKTQEQ